MSATKPFDYTGVCVRVIDGDTLVVRLTRRVSAQVDAGFYTKVALEQVVTIEPTVRLRGVNAPEIHGASKVAGLKSKAAVEALAHPDQALRIVTFKDEKYGRWLADVFVQAASGEIDLAKYLLDHGLAVPFMVGP